MNLQQGEFSYLVTDFSILRVTLTPNLFQKVEIFYLERGIFLSLTWSKAVSNFSIL